MTPRPRSDRNEEVGRALQRLEGLVARASRRPRALSGAELDELARLYRHASSLHARLDTAGDDPHNLGRARRVLAAAHGLLYRPLERDARPWATRIWHYWMVSSPRTLRREWRLLVFSFTMLYGFAGVAYALVANDLGLAFGLLDPAVVAHTLEQLEGLEPGEPFRGNFTFGLDQSTPISGFIMAHNLGVAVIFFAAGLLPPFLLYVVALNGLMVGTYTAVAAHYGQAGEISSTLWCHGTLELQAFVLAGMAALVLVRGWLMPGPWSRSHAIRLDSSRALRVLAPVLPMLVVAGVIEGFVSPHADRPIRIATAVVTGGLFLAWLVFAGRGRRDVAAAP